jgi:hypothetical protein
MKRCGPDQILEVGNICLLMDPAREGHMTLRRIVTGFGLAVMVFGIWTLARAHSQVGTCTTTNGLGATAHSGIDARCVQTLMSYSLGFVFVASGLIIAVIALTMIAKQQRIDLHSELKAVPRTWAKRHYVATSDGLDGPDDAATPPLFSVKTG